jgi:hypothetical protein
MDVVEDDEDDEDDEEDEDDEDEDECVGTIETGTEKWS